MLAISETPLEEYTLRDLDLDLDLDELGIHAERESESDSVRCNVQEGGYASRISLVLARIGGC